MLVLTITLSACATKPETSNIIRSHSDNTKALGDEWDEGKQMVIKGKKLIKKGKEQIDDGNANLKKGTDMLEQGKKKMTKSEFEFNKLLQQKTINNPELY